jgi:hypothetical protein
MPPHSPEISHMIKITVGSQVAFNKLADATWFDVLEIEGFTLTIREHGTKFAVQHMDISLVKKVKK